VSELGKEPVSDFGKLFNEDDFENRKPLATLLSLYKGNFKDIIISTLFFIIKGAPIWVVPLVTAKIIDIATEPSKHSLTEFWIYILVVSLALIQNIPFHILYVKYMSRAIRYVEAGLRSALVRKLQQLSISFQKELKSGKLQSKVIRDVEAVEFLSRQIMITLLPAIITATITTVITISTSIIVALFFLVTIPITLILVRLFRKTISKNNNDFRKEIEEMSSKVSEMVEMIPITRAHALEGVEIKKIDDQLERVKVSGYQLDIVNAIFGSASWVTFQLFQILCLAFTSFLAYHGKMSIGDVVMYQGFFNIILGQVSGILNVYPNIAKGFESINSISEILIAKEVEDNKGKKKIKEVAGKFSFRDVNFSYNSTDKLVLENFNLEVKAGESIAFVGESGVGKSTILNLIIGFNKPTKGKILVDNIDMTKMDLRSYREFLAVVPQNNILFSGSIKDNITYGIPEISEEKISEIVELANLKEFIDKLPDGIETKVGEHGSKLSGGQRQRIAIARALIRNPQVIVFDEATSALDNISEYYVQQAMQQLVKGRTTFIVAHRLSTIRDADRIVVMKDGTCAEVGTFDELMEKKGEFYKLKKLQS
jgi:ATP-binding cassette subfamily B protein